MVNDNNESIRDISSEHMKMVFNSLNEVQELLIEAENGFQNFQGMVTNSPISLPIIQLRAFGLILSKFEMILGNTKAIIDQNFYKKSMGTLEAFRRNAAKEHLFSKVIIRYLPKKRKILVLQGIFYWSIKELMKMRVALLDQLSPILFKTTPQNKNKER